MTIEEAAAGLRAREWSAHELAQESLRRIREEQTRLNAFITVTEELALERARRADEELARGIERGPLRGIPYAMKDVFDMQGVLTTCGSRIFANRMAGRDCAAAGEAATANAAALMKNA